VTATHRQPLPSSPSRISFSISCLILLALVLSLSASSTLETSTVQYSVSVKVDGVVWLETVLRLLGRLPGGVRATSAYDGFGLEC
jgi:hypothetical protein